VACGEKGKFSFKKEGFSYYECQKCKTLFVNPRPEENAFLQITKSGGQTVVDGTLYTTDSPCQLCSKKAMQLKISRIVYIDAYPDISIEHTLQAGKKEKWPKFEMFKGAIGSAYFKLYIPIIGIKDEINEIIRFKKSDS
ncbi:MAG: hypothetical protein DSY46_04410, partial [Hydrogenimonas sp.]